MSILVTGVAGFVGMHLAEALAARGDEVLGLDIGEDGVDPDLTAARRARLHGLAGLRVERADRMDRATLAALGRNAITAVVHLADDGSRRRPAAGRRHRPESRIDQHLALLEWCRDRPPALRHLVYALDRGDVSIPPVIRGDAEDILARAYARLHRLPQTGLGLHGAYGSWGRPDMPVWRAADAIVAGRTVTVDDEPVPAIHVDDIVTGVLAAIDRPPADETGVVPLRHYDLAGPEPVTAARLVDALGATLGLQVRRSHARAGAQADRAAAADPEVAAAGLGWRAAVSIEDGAARFVDWHRHWHARP